MVCKNIYAERNPGSTHPSEYPKRNAPIAAMPAATMLPLALIFFSSTRALKIMIAVKDEEASKKSLISWKV